MKLYPLVGICLAVVAFAPTRAEAQHPHTRNGFWFNAGLGVASYGCEDCDGRESGGSATLALGGTLSQHVNIGVGVNLWAKEVSGVDLVASTTTAMIRFYPSATGGFYLTGGLGVGALSASASNVSISESGVGVLLGLGIDIRIGSNLSLTPFWHGNGIGLDGGSANFGQLGLGLTVH